ncbi:GNAT family N-acetyltransferase [Gottfriedia luciferensis]|uniref:GNAT family N-acetyltransferase n=1 Tax=Gottfriedia luciferensis TaxID=178774 RepID=UPI000B4519A9|nr:GNAT family N-acetyltransferase [Gottfriedia luciferensis]
MNYNIEVSLEDNNEFAIFIKNKIKEFNNKHSLHHNEARKIGAVHPINIMVSDHNKNWIGGLTAEVYWDWIEIKDFWFSEEFRGKGIGRDLLVKAEEIALSKGATKSLLTTFEFQARSFYEIYGYKIVGEVKDYPPGSSYYTMVKSLV